VLNSQTKRNVKFVDYEITTHKKSLPSAKVKLDFNGTILESISKGDGGYDAFMKALRKALKNQGVQAPKLIGYEVQIPPGGKTDALVETIITWESSDIPSPFTTIGVDSDQIEAAIEATEKMLNICFN